MAGVANEYASALYALSEEEGLEPVILGEARQLLPVFDDNPELLDILRSPAIPKDERVGLLDRIFGDRLHPYTLSCMQLMVKKGRGGLIPEVMKEYIKLWYRNSGIAVAEVTSAVPLDEKQKERLHFALEKKTGRDVETRFTVDPSVMGGVSVKIDGVLYEDTVKGRIEEMRRALKDRVL